MLSPKQQKSQQGSQPKAIDSAHYAKIKYYQIFLPNTKFVIESKYYYIFHIFCVSQNYIFIDISSSENSYLYSAFDYASKNVLLMVETKTIFAQGGVTECRVVGL